MYTDPWDLKHSIQQLQQQQRQNNHLLSSQKHSSSTYSQHLNEDIIHPNSHYQLSEDQPSDQANSDQNTSELQSNLSYQKPLSETLQSSHDVELVEKHRNIKPRNKYGNLIVFLQTSSTILSIGPNYLFFFFAYLSFTISSIYLVYLVNTSLQNITFKIFNFGFCALQNLSYLLVAFSNPGVKLPQTDTQMSSKQNKQRHCRSCGAFQQRKTYHCRQCDVCVSEYDHHCPWTSKCIAGGNLKRFYLFVMTTPFYIFYYVVAFMICMANLTIPHAKNLKPVIPAAV